MFNEPKLGDPVDTTEPNGPKFGDLGHPLPVVHESASSSTPVAAPAKPFAPLIGDVVTLKSGGPAMTVTGFSVPGELPGIKVQWFNPLDHTINEKSFLLSSLMVPIATSTWGPVK